MTMLKIIWSILKEINSIANAATFMSFLVLKDNTNTFQE